jgi:DNA-binding CsgD family transcriptional regulator/tetratricopeptide (TPR) repeat protein
MRQVVATTASEGSNQLLERARELSVLGECFEAVQSSSLGRVVLIGGEAGVGKSALLQRFCEERRESARILWGACDPLFTPRPLGPLLAVAEGAGGELEELVASGVMPHEVVAALVRELRGRAATVFVLEDVQWADEATLDVLRLLARRVETVPALIVASYRDDELDRAHPLRIVLGELATSHSVARLKLAALSPAAVAQLAEPHAVDPDELYRKTAGNPFFVVEALAAQAEEIPDTVRDVVFARAARLSPRAKRLLEAVAVVPTQAELWLLEALAGETIDGLDECLTSGMLTSEPAGVGFRHELARLAIEESIALNRRVDLHRKALATLADPPGDTPDLARLAHHAEAAGDVDAVLRFAPAAAVRAASLGAHRESAAQYARALRFGDRLLAAERAELLERRSRECYITDQYDEGIAALEAALECRRTVGDTLKEGEALHRLSEFLWCPGRTAEAERSARAAVDLLERVSPGRELASAYANLAAICAAAARSEEAIAWAGRALDLAERLDDTEIAVHALATIGACKGDNEKLEQSLERARRAGLAVQVGRIFILAGAGAVEGRRHSRANTYLERGIAYCSERGLELFRLYLLAYRARLELDQGRWSEAAESASSVLRIPRTSTTPRIVALVVLALVRARRGDPEVRPLLDEAWTLAEPTGELPRLGPVAAARAEVGWLEGDRDAVAAATEGALPLALERKAGWLIGELTGWRRRVGLDDEIPPEAAEPYALGLAEGWAQAAELWSELGCPYEAALALADVDGEESMRRALDELQALEARPAAGIVARRLRERGARGLPRGPRLETQENPAGLTRRELEVLRLVAQGLRNVEIAERLFLAEKTVDHHVSAILRKLDVHTRGEASAEAVKLGVAGQDR